MPRRGMLGLVIFFVAGTATIFACSEDESVEPAYDPEIVAFLDDNFGVRLGGWVDADEVYVVDSDGFLVLQADGSTAIEGFGERALRMETRIQPEAAGGEIFLRVIDVELEDERFFLYNYDERFVVFGQDLNLDESRGVGVQQNPDGTYEVWTFDDSVSDLTTTETVPDGYAAMRRVEELNRYRDIPPHVIMTAYAMGLTTVPEARSQAKANGGIRKVAAAPSACSIFKTFCDCIACSALDRDGDCDLCPEL